MNINQVAGRICAAACFLAVVGFVLFSMGILGLLKLRFTPATQDSGEHFIVAASWLFVFIYHAAPMIYIIWYVRIFERKYKELEAKLDVYKRAATQEGADAALSALAQKFRDACLQQIEFLSGDAQCFVNEEDEKTRHKRYQLQYEVDSAKKEFWEFHGRILDLNFKVRPSHKDYLLTEKRPEAAG